jgi:MYXO-CTERM domain-containing protein
MEDIMNKSTAKNFLLRLGIARAVLIAGVLLTMGLAQSAKADTVYTYAGQPFAYNGSWGLTGVQGSFTVSSPLAADTAYNLTPDTLGGTITGYDFTDGKTTWDLANYVTGNPAQAGYNGPSDFSVTTNASGEIVSWDLNIYNSVGVITTCSSCNSLGGPYDDTSVFYNYDGYNNPGNGAGTWTGSGPTPTPEPSTSSLLFGAGLLGLLALAARSKRRPLLFFR